MIPKRPWRSRTFPSLYGGSAVTPVVTKMSQVSVPTLWPVPLCRSTEGHTSGMLVLPLVGSADPIYSTGPAPSVELRGTTK